MTPARNRVLTSVVIPTFNRRDLVLRAVQSVLEQRDAAVEVIVVDDGSTDDTVAALARRFGDDPRVRVVAGNHRHASAARNTGFAAAHGEFISFLDSDDYWLDGTLAAFHSVFARHPELAFVSVDGSTIASGERQAIPRIVAGDSPGWSHPRFPHARLRRETIDVPNAPAAELLLGDFFPAIVNGDLFYLTALMMRRASAAAAGPFNARFRFFNDWEFFARLCLTGPGAYLAIDSVRRDTGRDDQISRGRSPAALARRHLFIVRSLSRRSHVAASYRVELDAALADAKYRLAHCLARDGRQRWARRYLYSCIRGRHKRAYCLLRLGASLLHVTPRFA